MLNPPMKYSKKGLSLTKQFEGYANKAYPDSGGIWTCGYGHTSGVGPSTTCTQELAEQWLIEDVQIAVTAVNRLVAVPLTQNEFDALVDFVFNVGANAFATSTLLRLLNAGNDADAAKQLERWDKVKGKPLLGLLRRRLAEQKLFNTPDDKE